MPTMSHATPSLRYSFILVAHKNVLKRINRQKGEKKSEGSSHKQR